MSGMHWASRIYWTRASAAAQPKLWTTHFILMYMLWRADLADFLYKGIDTDSQRENDQKKDTDFVQQQ